MKDFITFALPWIIIGITAAIFIVSVKRNTGNKKNAVLREKQNKDANTPEPADDKNFSKETNAEEADSEKANTEEPENHMTEGMCIGMCIGVALGSTGVISLALGISLGMCIGMCIGMNIKK